MNHSGAFLAFLSVYYSVFSCDSDNLVFTRLQAMDNLAKYTKRSCIALFLKVDRYISDRFLPLVNRYSDRNGSLLTNEA